MRSLLVLLLSASITPLAQAQEGGRFKVFKEDSENRASIRNSRPLNVYYEKISWNQSPTEIESGYLYLRDRDTDNIIELKLTETKPDSGVFNVELPIGVIKQKQIAAEIYSAPQEMLKTENRVALMQDLIKDKSVKRKPFLLRVLRERGQILDVFDDKEQAIAAYNKYLQEMGLAPGQLESESIIEVANQEKPVRKKAIDTSTLQTLLLANENDLTASNEKIREMREVLKNLELKRRQELQEEAKT